MSYTNAEASSALAAMEKHRGGVPGEIGAVWPHKNGNGFDLVLFEQISVSGRIVCTERKDKAAE